MTFFQNPHRGFMSPNNIQQLTQNFVPVGPNLLQDPRTGLVYMQTPQGLQISMQPSMMQPMYPNPTMGYPNMQPNLTAGFNNAPTGFNNMYQNNFNQDQTAPSFNPKFNTSDLKPNNTNNIQSRYELDVNTSQTTPASNVQSWNIKQTAKLEKPSIKFSETDMRYLNFIPFTTRIKEKEFKYEELDMDYIFTDPCDIVSLCMKYKNQEDSFDEDIVLIASDVKIGREYFITSKEDKKLIKDLFDNDKSIKAFINEFTYALNKAASADAISYLLDYNCFITKQINYILDKYLQTKISIDSFIDDYFELLNVLEKQIQSTNIIDIISTEIIKINSYTKELMQDNEDKSGVCAIAIKKTIVIIPDVVEIYTKHYYDNNFDIELNAKDDARFVKLVNFIVEQLKDKFDVNEGFIIGFINCKYINVNILNVNNTVKMIVS